MNNITNEYHEPIYSGGETRLASVLPLRQVVLFPGTEMTLDVGRRTSKAAVRSVRENGRLMLLTQKEVEVEAPEKKDLYPIGTMAEVLEIIPQGAVAGMRIVVRIIGRVELLDVMQMEPYIQATWRTFETTTELEENNELVHIAYSRKLTAELVKFSRLTGRLNQEQLAHFESTDDLEERIDYLASVLLTDVADRYEILSEPVLELRYEKIIRHLTRENELISLEAELNSKLKVALDKSQREYYLREKIKVINEELGEAHDKESDIAEFRERIDESKMAENVKKRLHREVDRLSRVSTMSPDYGNLINYIEFALDLPWETYREENNDINHAEKILDEDHYGLQKVKDRILEFLAVRALHGESKGSIICLVGPPGVGKTSLAKSVARATNRDYIRLSLGGIQDEAEIRGHRRTYVGALPGRLLAGISNAGSANPVFLLDEVDKLNRDFRGDPASALLEALDPAQNNTFSDHYLDIPFDLSKVLFLTTANTTQTIPGPLKDRMEIIEVPSYTEDEKLEIAKQYLTKRQITDQGLNQEHISFSDGALLEIIRNFTAESGVRELERKIGSICRKVARLVVSGKTTEKVRITKRNVSDYLGKPTRHHLMTDEKNEVGVAVGMAWTAVGGEILQIECQTMPGKGKLQLTGQLGDVMKESGELALSVVRSKSKSLALDDDFLEKLDLHVHVPQGAVPKDGPSAGITLTTAIASALTGKKVYKDIAMTGEITLRGRVLEVGGIRDKVIAAQRAGCRAVVLPKDNKRDLEDIPSSILKELDVHFCETIDEVWNIVFVKD